MPAGDGTDGPAGASHPGDTGADAAGADAGTRTALTSPGDTSTHPPDAGAASLAASLAADRAEALAQLDIARATLARLESRRLSPPAPGHDPIPAVVPDVLRATAAEVRRAVEAVNRAEAEAEALGFSQRRELKEVDQALADAEAARQELAPAWRRTLGALISAGGMAIVIMALGWSPWFLLVPTVLVLAVTAGLRATAAAWRTASAQSAEALAAVGVAGPEDLAPLRARQEERDTAAARLAEARLQRSEVEARWRKLAGGTDPNQVEALIRRLSAPQAAEPEGPEPVDPEAERALTLARKLEEEARHDLERAETGLRELAASLGLGDVAAAEVPAAVDARMAAPS